MEVGMRVGRGQVRAQAEWALANGGRRLTLEQIAAQSHTSARRVRGLSRELLGRDFDDLDREEIVLPVALYEERLLPWLGVDLNRGGTI